MRSRDLYISVLDWEKAFDEIDRDALLSALKRLDIDQHFVEVPKDCYKHPTFYVQDDYSKSDTKKQLSGIRQRCPISPYLFVLVMACIDHDVRLEISQETKENRLPRIDFDSVYYADDTILFSRDKKSLEELLEPFENISRSYGLKLNREKRVALNMNETPRSHGRRAKVPRWRHADQKNFGHLPGQ